MTPPPENPALARIQQNVLARSERRLLTWLCAHLPAWVTPDKLTVTGMVGAVAIFLGYALSTFSAEWLFLALAGHVVQWLGDSLDGSLARFRHDRKSVVVGKGGAERVEPGSRR